METRFRAILETMALDWARGQHLRSDVERAAYLLLALRRGEISLAAAQRVAAGGQPEYGE